MLIAKVVAKATIGIINRLPTTKFISIAKTMLIKTKISASVQLRKKNEKEAKTIPSIEIVFLIVETVLAIKTKPKATNDGRETEIIGIK